MRNYTLISSILSRPWLIDPQWVQNNLALVHSIISGGDVQGHSPRKSSSYGIDVPDTLPDRMSAEQYIEANMYNPRVLTAQGSTVRASFWRSFNEAPKNSIALIPVIGPVSKYYDCGIAGTVDMARWVKEANESPNITAIMLQLDTPGGMVDGTQTFVDAILGSQKPVIGYVDDGMSASAGMWIASACDEIILSQKTDMVGSIGVLTTLADYSGYFEQKGIKLHEIYAPQSKDKNKDYRDALKGDYKAVRDELAFIADVFINSIKTNRGDKLNLDAGDPFTGKMYFGDEAIAIGLADKYGSIEHAVESCYTMATTKKSNSKNSINMFGNKFPQLSALKGKSAEEITAEALASVNAELKAQGIENVQLTTEALFIEAVSAESKTTVDAVTKLQADLEKAQSDLKAANTAKDAADANVAKLTGEVKTLTDRVAELEKGDAGAEAGLTKETAEKPRKVDSLDAPVEGFKPTPLSDLSTN